VTKSGTTQAYDCFGVSIIIPSNHCHADLIKVTLQVCEQSVTPAEIVIVDSSREKGRCPQQIADRCSELAVELIYEMVDQALPGHARNLGMTRASSKYIGFLDVKTIPSKHWIKNAKRQLEDPSVSGVWGFTTFEAKSGFEELIRDGFFGRNPRRTLPGSIFNKEVIPVIGTLIAWARAGEDTDWIQRIDLSKIKFLYPQKRTLSYTGLLGQDAKTLAKKWARNYSSSRTLPHLFPHRIIAWMAFYFLIILLALSWNNLIAGWNTQSITYLPNITKLATTIPLLSYLITRGTIVPYQRGVPVAALFPTRWLSIALVCLIGDATKAIMLLSPKFRKKTGYAVD